MKKHLLFLLSFIFLIITVHNVDAQARLNKIKKSGVLKVGTSGNQPPFSMEAKDGSLIGYEVDIAELLAESMKVKLEMVKMPFSELISSLEKGDVDMIMSGMTITMERNMKVAFVGPYILSGKSILTKVETIAKADEAEDLNQSDLRITALKGSTSETFVTSLLPEATFLPAEDYDKAVSKLLKDEANVMLADFPVCALTILRNPTANLATLTEPLTIEPIGMAIAPGDPLLMNFLENYLNALLMAGMLDDLEKYWFQNGSWLAEMK